MYITKAEGQAEQEKIYKNSSVNGSSIELPLKLSKGGANYGLIDQYGFSNNKDQTMTVH